MSRTFIAIPSLGFADIRFSISLASLWKPKGTALAASPRSMPDVARNALFEQALKYKFDQVLFLDDDMVVDAGLLDQLQKVLDSDDKIAAAAPLAFRRHPPFHPCVMKKAADGYHPVTDFSGDRFDVDAIHFAATLVRVSWLEKVAAPRFDFTKDGDSVTGEDIVLSRKLQELGARLVCDASIPDALHIGIPHLVGRKVFEAVHAPKPSESTLVVP